MHVITNEGEELELFIIHIDFIDDDLSVDFSIEHKVFQQFRQLVDV